LGVIGDSSLFAYLAVFGRERVGRQCGGKGGCIGLYELRVYHSEPYGSKGSFFSFVCWKCHNCHKFIEITRLKYRIIFYTKFRSVGVRHCNVWLI
jgi:hypothetical protein